MRKKALLFTALLLLAGTSVADGLRLIVEKSRIGFVQVYLENTGSTELTVVTGKLSYTGTGSTVEISPEQHVWQQAEGERLLKGSLVDYAPVVLKPGDVTFIKNPNIRVVTKLVKYRIPEDWATLHGTWSGVVEAPFN